MADKNINIKVGTTGAGKAKKELGGLNSAIGKMGKAVGIASAAYFGAKGLISSLSTVIELAGIQEQAEKKLETALGKTSQALLNQASALQKVTTFGDESIIGVQASLAAFLDSEEAIMKATEATLDLSVAMGMDLKSSGDLIAKTLGSSTNAMSRYGVEVEGAVGSSARLESLTRNVAELFGGQATAQAETMAGALQQAKNSAGDLGEAIGEKLSPLVSALAKDFSKTVDELTAFISADDSEQITVILSEAQVAMMNFRKELEGMSIEELLFEQERLAIALSMPLDSKTLDLYDHQLNVVRQTLAPLIDDIKRTEEAEISFGAVIEKVSTRQIELELQKGKLKKEQLIADLKGAALQQSSAKDALKAVIRAESMEAVAGYIASVFKTVPYPFNLILAATGGAAVAGVIDKGLASFATGGDFVTSGPQMIMVGDNPGGQERVRVDPLSSPNINGSGGGITLNISAPLVDETILDTIIPAIEKAQRMNLA